MYGDISLDKDEKNNLWKPQKIVKFGKEYLYTFFQEVQVTNGNAKLRRLRKEQRYSGMARTRSRSQTRRWRSDA